MADTERLDWWRCYRCGQKVPEERVRWRESESTWDGAPLQDPFHPECLEEKQ